MASARETGYEAKEDDEQDNSQSRDIKSKQGAQAITSIEREGAFRDANRGISIVKGRDSKTVTSRQRPPFSFRCRCGYRSH